MQRDANGAVIYGPAPAATYPTSPPAQLQAYIEACQTADELHDAQFPHGGPALNHRPLDSELKTILLDAISASGSVHTRTCTSSTATVATTGRLARISTTISTTWSCTTRTVSSPAHVTATQRSKTAMDLGVLARAAGAATLTALADKRRQAQIKHAVSVRQVQQLASNTSANSNINYQSSNTGGGLPSSGTRERCKNCKSTSHGTKWCPSPKCYEKNCGKTFASADERKAHFIQEHGFTSKPATSPLKSSLKDGKGNKVKFVKSQRLVGKVHRVQTKTPKRQQANDSEDDSDSSIGSDSSISVEAAPRALIWRNDPSSSKKGRKVFHLRNVSTIHSVRKSKRLSEKRDNDKPDAKASSEPEAVVPPAGQPAAPSTSSAQPTSSTQSRRIQQSADTVQTRSRREEEYHGYIQPRGTETKIRKRTQVNTSSQPTRSRV
jgi:hypothetical protein